MKKIFGRNPTLATMNMTFILLIILAIVGVFCTYNGIDVWNIIIRIMTLSVGFIFGKSSVNKE